MEEIGEAIRQFESMGAKQEEIKLKIQKIEQKNASIRAAIGTSHNTTNMLKRWDNFQVAALEMERILTEQKGRMQEETVRKSQNLQHEAAKVFKKIQNIKPDLQKITREEVLELYLRIKDWQVSWRQVEQKYHAIQADIKHFSMKSPDLSGYLAIVKKVERQMNNWTVFMVYREKV